VATTKHQTSIDKELSTITRKISDEKLKQEREKLNQEINKTRKAVAVTARSLVQAEIEETNLNGDRELKKQSDIALQSLQAKTAIATNNLAITHDELGASDVRVKLAIESTKARLTIESVKLAETQLEATQLLDQYRDKYGTTPKLSQTKVTQITPKTA